MSFNVSTFNMLIYSKPCPCMGTVVTVLLLCLMNVVGFLKGERKDVDSTREVGVGVR